MSDKTLKQLEDELLEIRVVRLINKAMGECLMNSSADNVDAVQHATARRIIGLLREFI